MKRPAAPTLAEFARDVLGVELPPHAEILIDAVRRGRRLAISIRPRHGRALSLRIVRAYLEAHPVEKLEEGSGHEKPNE